LATQSRNASFIASFSEFDPLVTDFTSAHAEYVGRLTRDIFRTHVDRAGQVEQRADGGGGHAVLAGAGLGDDAGLAHAPGQQDLADAVVDLVRAGMIQLVALEVDLRAAEMFGQPLGEIERAGPPHIMLEVVFQLLPEIRVVVGGVPGLFDLEDQRHQGFGHEAAPEYAEMTLLVRPAPVCIDLLLFHESRRAPWKLGAFCNSIITGQFHSAFDRAVPVSNC
jgi:hypothetical protein